MMWAPPRYTGTFQALFVKKGFVIVADWVWHKEDFQATSNPNLANASLEHFFVAKIPYGVSSHFKSFPNPVDRSPIIHMPVLKTFTMHDGFRLDYYEKPVQLEMKIFERYTQAGDIIDVVGSGSGSACIAALELGRNVRAFDDDMRRWNGTKQRLISYVTNKQETNKPGGSDPAFDSIERDWHVTVPAQTVPYPDHNDPERAQAKNRPRSEAHEEHRVEDSPALARSLQVGAVCASQTKSVYTECASCGDQIIEHELKKCIHCTGNIHADVVEGPGEQDHDFCGITCVTCLRFGRCSLNCMGICPKSVG